MKSIQLLSEAIIDTLKEFSSEKRTLTLDSLCSALSGRGDVCSLLSELSSANFESEPLPDPLAAGGAAAVNPARQPESTMIFRQVH